MFTLDQEALKEGYVRFYHSGSKASPITEIKPYDYSTGNLFGGLFALTGGPGAYGDGTVYYMDVPEDRVLTTWDMVYGEEGEAAIDALNRILGPFDNEEDFENAYTAVIEDNVQKVDEDALTRLFGEDSLSDAVWAAQRVRGQVAARLGYQAVEMEDENGTSYLVLPGVKVHPIPRRNPASARRSDCKALGNLVQAVAGSNEAFALLDAEELDSFQTGGCAVLAAAVERVFGLMQATVGSDVNDAEHIVNYCEGGFIDSDGWQTKEQLFEKLDMESSSPRRWRVRRGVAEHDFVCPRYLVEEVAALLEAHAPRKNPMPEGSAWIGPVYHGTERGNFLEFLRQEGNHDAFFFTSDKGTARSYSGSDLVLPLPHFKSLKELRAFIDKQQANNEPHFVDFERNETGEFALWSEDFAELGVFKKDEDLLAFVNNYLQKAKVSGIYAVFLHIKNPLVVHGAGAPWDEIPSECLQKALAKHGIEESLEEPFVSTYDIEQLAEEHGFDSFVIHDIYDFGPLGVLEQESTIYGVFDSRQIKSDKNRGTWDTSDPIITNPSKSRKNPARARRSENRKIEKHSVDEFGEEWTDVDYEWIDYPPFLTEGHFDLPMVKEAARIASRAKESKQLGRGHFGEAFVVETSKGPVLVKVAAERMLYQDQRPWTRKEQRANLMHEAGVANELEDMGYTIVPRSVYVELEDGTPAIVREYGEEVAPGELSGREFYDLERSLFSLEEDTGWRVQDDLLLLRRPDGSLFIGDVGLWGAPDVGRQKKERLLYSNLPSLLTKLGEHLFGQRFSSLSRVQELQTRVEEKDPDHVFAKMFREELEKALASREALGIPSS